MEVVTSVSTKRMRCAVVGLGQGMHDVNVISHHPRMSLVAVCDTDRERYEWLVGTRPIEDSSSDLAQQPGYRALVQSLRDLPEVKEIRYVDSYPELLKQDDIDAVVIVVGDALHEQFTIAALEAGKYVLCTKPMASSMEAALKIAAAARKHPGHYMLSLQMGYSPLVQTITGLIEEGALGNVHLLRFDYHRQPWRPVHSFKNAKIDGTFLKEGVHWIDMIYRISGYRPFTKIAAFGGIDANVGKTDFEDNGVTIIDYGDFRVYHGFSYFRSSHRPEDLLIAGDKGTLRGTFWELYLENNDGERTITIPGFRMPLQWLVGYEDMHDEFARMVLDGKEPYSNWETALENTLTAYAAQMAVAENRMVTREELSAFDWRLVFSNE
jgi:predicted dehydrogenase